MVQNISSKAAGKAALSIPSDTEEVFTFERGKSDDDLSFSRSKSVSSLSEEEIEEENSYYMETSSGSLDEEILTQIQVTNNLLGIILAFQIFMFGFAIMKFFMRIIENNVTKHFV